MTVKYLGDAAEETTWSLTFLFGPAVALSFVRVIFLSYISF